MAIMLVGIAIACVVIYFGIVPIISAKKICSGTDVPPYGVRILGGSIIAIGIAILFSTFYFTNVFSDISVQDWKYVGIILFGIAIFFVVIVGIAFIRVEIDEAEEKISEKTRKKIGISILVGSAVLTVIFVVLVLANPLGSISNNEERKCGYCGDEGAYYKFGSYYYCSDCYDGLVDAKDRVENK